MVRQKLVHAVVYDYVTADCLIVLMARSKCRSFLIVYKKGVISWQPSFIFVNGGFPQLYSKNVGLTFDNYAEIYLFLRSLYVLFLLLQNDSGYLTGKRKHGCLASGKENILPNKKVRKALAPSWSSTQMSSSDMLFAIETPVRI